MRPARSAATLLIALAGSSRASTARRRHERGGPPHGRDPGEGRGARRGGDPGPRREGRRGLEARAILGAVGKAALVIDLEEVAADALRRHEERRRAQGARPRV